MQKKNRASAAITINCPEYQRSESNYLKNVISNRLQMQDIRTEIVNVTYKEVMILWNLSANAAQKRLNAIRFLLNKKKLHKLTPYQYCIAEDISLDEFYTSLENYYHRISKKAS